MISWYLHYFVTFFDFIKFPFAVIWCCTFKFGPPSNCSIYVMLVRRLLLGYVDAITVISILHSNYPFTAMGIVREERSAYISMWNSTETAFEPRQQWHKWHALKYQQTSIALTKSYWNFHYNRPRQFWWEIKKLCFEQKTTKQPLLWYVAASVGDFITCYLWRKNIL
jgi:hypothetical protein